jgi:hypothetical protein
MKLLIMQTSPTSHPSWVHIFPSEPVLKYHLIMLSLNVRDQILHPCKATCKITVLLVLVCRCSNRRGIELRIFLFSTASRTALGPTQPPIQWVPGALSLEIKQPRREADHSPPSSTEVKECVELYLHSPNKPSLRGA